LLRTSSGVRAMFNSCEWPTGSRSPESSVRPLA
jgi:hypothetical protein